VPIRKEIPPLRQGSAGQAPQVPTIQSLLADIQRGTAYDARRINEAFRKTPIEVRQTLESVGFLSRLQAVAKKFALHIDETGELVSESGLVMLGLTLPTQFVDNLTRRLRQPRDKTMAIGQAVNMEVFRPVREILRKMSAPSVQPTQDIPPQKPEQKIDTGYRFAPSISPTTAPTTPQNLPVVTPNYSEPKPPLPSVLEEQKAKLQATPEVKKYISDPYREPL
ncbi:MAG: hypothetical protein Q8R17_01970, partial [bacterium]|nr:hypothetical protein [bacterium]